MAVLLSGCKNQYLRGYYTRAQFLDSAAWKHPIDVKYKPDMAYMDSLRTLRPDSFDVVLFLGTWCSDSKKWVPRFFALQPQLPVRNLQIISMDTTKRDERRMCSTYRVDSIPAFIFQRNGQEFGRIRVKPMKVKGDRRRLERDIYRLLKRAQGRER